MHCNLTVFSFGLRQNIFHEHKTWSLKKILILANSVLNVAMVRYSILWFICTFTTTKPTFINHNS